MKYVCTIYYIAVGAASQWSNERIMVYFKLMLQLNGKMLVNDGEMLVNDGEMGV